MSKILFAGDLHLYDKTPISRLDDYPNTILNKLDTILKVPADFYLFAGDWFHSPNVSREYIVKVIEVLKKHEGKPIFTVIGNHDVPLANSSNINNSPLGILFATGLVQRLVNLSVDNYRIWGCDYDQAVPIPFLMEKSILVAHKFYMSGDAKDMVVEVEAGKFDFCFLGHDHEPHAMTMTDKLSNIYRTGSISRMTGSKENTERDYFSVLLVDTVTSEVKEQKFQANANVFNKVFLDVKREIKKEGKLEMDKIFTKVKNMSSLYEVLRTDKFDAFPQHIKDLMMELYDTL